MRIQILIAAVCLILFVTSFTGCVEKEEKEEEPVRITGQCSKHGTSFNNSINIATVSDRCKITDVTVVIMNPYANNETVFTADFSSVSIINDGNPHLYKIPGPSNYQNVTFVDNDGNGSVDPNEKFWISRGTYKPAPEFVMPGYKIVIKVKGRTAGEWTA